MFFNVTVAGTNVKRAVVIPESAIVEDAGDAS